MSEIKLRDRVTGEIIVVQDPMSEKPSSDKKKWYDQRAELVNKEIAERGTLGRTILENLRSPNPIRKGMGTLGAVAAPISLATAGVVNPALAVQQGRFNPMELLREAKAGVTGQKMGQIQDVGYGGGFPKPLAVGTDLFLSIALPAKIVVGIGKAYGGITKLTDKGIMKAGKSLVSATKEAEKYAGQKLGEAFAKVDHLPVKDYDFLNYIVKLPQTLLSKLEETFGHMDELASNLTIGKLRAVKQFIGKLKPTLWGKGERGLAENIEAEDINKAYAGIKSLLRSNLVKQAGEKVAKALMKTEDTFSKISRSSDYVRQVVMEKTLQMATKSGALAKKIAVEGDTSGRTALNILRSMGGKTAEKDINKAVAALEAFNRTMAITDMVRRVSGAVILGGAAGAVGGRMMRKTIGEE